MTKSEREAALNLALIRERCEKATQGAWIADEDGAITADTQAVARVYQSADLPCVEEDDPAFVAELEANTAFIAHAREDIPALLTEVERLRRLLPPGEVPRLSGEMVREAHHVTRPFGELVPDLTEYQAESIAVALNARLSGEAGQAGGAGTATSTLIRDEALTEQPGCVDEGNSAEQSQRPSGKNARASSSAQGGSTPPASLSLSPAQVERMVEALRVCVGTLADRPNNAQYELDAAPAEALGRAALESWVAAKEPR